MSLEKEKLALRIVECAGIVGNAASLEQKTAIPKRTLSTYITGEAEPKTLRLAAIAKAAGVSAHWLATGEGVKFLSENYIKEQGGGYKVWSEFTKIPLYNIEAPAGHGSALEDEEIKDGIAFRTDWLQAKGFQHAYLATIITKGDSMEGTINNGDILLVNLLDTNVGEDGIYVIRRDGHLFAKRLQLMFSGELYIKSDNPVYNTQVISAEKASDLKIVGRVVWIGHEI